MVIKGQIRRFRNKLMVRGQQIESIKPYNKEGKAYVRGLEYALEAFDDEFGDLA